MLEPTCVMRKRMQRENALRRRRDCHEFSCEREISKPITTTPKKVISRATVSVDAVDRRDRFQLSLGKILERAH